MKLTLVLTTLVACAAAASKQETGDEARFLVLRTTSTSTYTTTSTSTSTAYYTCDPNATVSTLTSCTGRRRRRRSAIASNTVPAVSEEAEAQATDIQSSIQPALGDAHSEGRFFIRTVYTTVTTTATTTTTSTDSATTVRLESVACLLTGSSFISGYTVSYPAC